MNPWDVNVPGMNLRVVILCDAGHEVGYGHLVRSCALAERLSDSILFIGEYDDDAVSHIKGKGHAVMLAEPGGGKPLVSRIDIFEATVPDADAKSGSGSGNASDRDAHEAGEEVIFIIDSYEADDNLMAEMKHRGYFAVCFSDFNNGLRIWSDVVINGNIQAPGLGYKGSGDTCFLLGPKYMVLREEFRERRERVVNPKAERVLVTMGGSDLRGVTLKVLEALSKSGFKITAVIGPSFRNADEIRNFASRHGNIDIALNPDTTKMKELFCEADIAVTAGGSTIYEGAVTGTPMIIISQAENQIGSAAAMAERGAAIYLGDADGVDGEGILRAAESLAADRELRERMSRRGMELVDGLGADRCAERIMERFAQKHHYGTVSRHL